MEDKIHDLLAEYGCFTEGMRSNEVPEFTDKFIGILKQHGWVKLPGNAQNVTITTSDNPNDKLMTREQWEAESA